MALYLGVNNDGTFVSSDYYRLLDSNDLLLCALPENSNWKINLNGIAYRLNVIFDEKEDE